MEVTGILLFGAMIAAALTAVLVLTSAGDYIATTSTLFVSAEDRESAAAAEATVANSGTEVTEASVAEDTEVAQTAAA